jgi:DNA-binding NarL/FixJ family response regulator
VVGEAADVDGMLVEVQDTRPDVVLVNWDLPDLQPREALRELRCLHRPVKVVAFGPHDEAQCAALTVGLDAFVSRQEPVEMLLNTVRCVGQLSPCFV